SEGRAGPPRGLGARGLVGEGAPARVVVHGGLRRTDVEPAALRRRRGRRALEPGGGRDPDHGRGRGLLRFERAGRHAGPPGELAAVRIDAHQHFWRYDAREYDWIEEGMEALRRDFLPADLRPLLAHAGFDGCVAVEARQSLEETRFLLDLAEAND